MHEIKLVIFVNSLNFLVTYVRVMAVASVAVASALAVAAQKHQAGTLSTA
jgi:hypothetical protein